MKYLFLLFCLVGCAAPKPKRIEIECNDSSTACIFVDRIGYGATVKPDVQIWLGVKDERFEEHLVLRSNSVSKRTDELVEVYWTSDNQAAIRLTSSFVKEKTVKSYDRAGVQINIEQNPR